MSQRLVAIIILTIIAGGLIWHLGSHTETTSKYVVPEGQLIFRMAEHRSADHPTNEGVQLFADLVEERTEGGVKILIYDGHALGDEASIIEQIGYGGIDFARIGGVYLDEYMEEMHTLCLPGLYDNNEELMAVFEDETISTQISETLKNEKINVLTWYPGSTRGIFYSDASMDHLNRGKIAIPKSQMKILEFEFMGFQPIPSVQEYVNSYLDGGYVQGVEGELLDFYYYKSYNNSSHFTRTESRIPEAIVASNAAWNQMTVEQQQLVAQTAKEVGLLTSQRIREEESDVQLSLEASGIIFDDIEQDQAYNQGIEQLTKAIGDLSLLDQIESILNP